MAGRLAQADPVAVAIPWLRQHPDVLALLGGDPSRVGGENLPPYPRLRLTDPPGSDRGLRWLLAPSLQIEALGDLDRTVPKKALRDLAYTALEALVELAEAATPLGHPVVTAVESSGGTGWVPMADGQPRYLSTVRLYLHPAP